MATTDSVGYGPGIDEEAQWTTGFNMARAGQAKAPVANYYYQSGYAAGVDSLKNAAAQQLADQHREAGKIAGASSAPPAMPNDEFYMSGYNETHADWLEGYRKAKRAESIWSWAHSDAYVKGYEAGKVTNSPLLGGTSASLLASEGKMLFGIPAWKVGAGIGSLGLAGLLGYFLGRKR